jgi:succinate dehydrogenase/fumarate reductase flavoprotein subunit
VVVGSGIAGLNAALRLRERADKVLVVTKGVPAVASDLEPTA